MSDSQQTVQYKQAAGDGKSLVYAADAGMNPLEAIEACTARAPNALGPKMASKSVQVKVGYDADVLASKGNRLTGIWLLAGAENVSHVWKAGKLYRAPGMKS